MPLNPLTHPVNVDSVFPVYRIISLPILINPLESGNLSVPNGEFLKSTVITSSNSSISNLKKTS